MELKKLAEARIRYNQLSGKPIDNKDLLLLELPKDKFKKVADDDYISMINDLAEDDEVNEYLTNKYSPLTSITQNKT